MRFAGPAGLGHKPRILALGVAMSRQTSQVAYEVSRAHERVPVALRVRVTAKGRQHFDLARDISEGGLGLSSSARLATGTRVAVRLELSREGAVELPGSVIWSSADAMGLRFEHLDASTADAIHRLRIGLRRC